MGRNQNVQADIYIESEAEEIYLPESSHISVPYNFGKNRVSLASTSDETGIVGYQKYLHIVNRLAVDNTDAHEPRLPELSQFLRVNEEEEEEEMNRKLAEYQAQKGRSGKFDDLME